MQKSFNVLEIMEVIPHRYPFLFVDKVIDVSDDFKEITAVKSVTYNEPFFTGHFPGKPVMPGVLQLEAIAQAAAFLVLKFDHTAKDYKGLALTGIKDFKYRNPVVPGDNLILNAKVLKSKGPYFFLSGSARVNDRVACEGDFNAVFLDKQERVNDDS
jgi:beta-hydroxyacyl-ACP dehydratase FabZ